MLDLALVKEDGVLYSGDLIFKGRVPFIGDADTKMWLQVLNKLRGQMSKVAENFVPLEGAYAKTNWKKFASLPAFKDTNRANTYNTYILLEREVRSKSLQRENG